MQFKLESAEVFVPDGLAVEQALARTTHMAVAAHQDDIEAYVQEFMERSAQDVSLRLGRVMRLN